MRIQDAASLFAVPHPPLFSKDMPRPFPNSVSRSCSDPILAMGERVVVRGGPVVGNCGGSAFSHGRWDSGRALHYISIQSRTRVSPQRLCCLRFVWPA